MDRLILKTRSYRNFDKKYQLYSSNEKCIPNYKIYCKMFIFIYSKIFIYILACRD